MRGDNNYVSFANETHRTVDVRSTESERATDSFDYANLHAGNHF